MARGCQGLLNGRRQSSLTGPPTPPPRFADIEAVKRVAGVDARLAAAAFGEIQIKGVLLAGSRRRESSQFARVWRGNLLSSVGAGNLFHCGELALPAQQFVNESVVWFGVSVCQRGFHIGCGQSGKSEDRRTDLKTTMTDC